MIENDRSGDCYEEKVLKGKDYFLQRLETERLDTISNLYVAGMDLGATSCHTSKKNPKMENAQLRRDVIMNKKGMFCSFSHLGQNSRRSPPPRANNLQTFN